MFRLRAEHLRAARGFVTCGECNHVFDVLQRIVDEPAPEPELATSIETPPESVVEIPIEASAEPEAVAPATVALPETDSEIAAATTVPGVFDEPPPAPGPQLGSEAALEAVALDMPPLFREVEAEVTAPNAPLLPESEHAILFEAPGAAAVDDAPIVPSPIVERDADDEAEVPEILREEIAALSGQGRSRARWLWALLALALLLALAAQVGYTYRAPLFERWPMLQPWAELLCARVGCDLRVPLATGTIELLARDVRDHPQYAGTLLVNATLHNNGSRPASYPVIQLGIYDHTGSVVGIRRFAPKEYLDQSIDIASGLPAGGSVYVVLEIAGTGNAADSFEFTFL